MGFVSTILGLIGFSFGVSLGMLIGYFFFIYPQPRGVKEPITTQLRDMDTKSLNKLLPEIPMWIKNPDYERIDWLNKFLHDMWPYLDVAICNIIRSTMKPIFDQYIGKYGIETIEFETLTLGTLPPTFQGIKVYEIQDKELVIEPAIRWAGNANIVVALKLFHFKFSAQLIDLQLSLVPRVTLKPLVPTFPCFANINASLMEKPKVDFGFKLLNGDLMAIPGLHHFVQDMVAKQIANMYHWPRVLELPILEVSSGATNRPVGILNVKVVRAMNLLKMDLLGKSDPYVKLKLSGERLRSKRTSIKMCNLNPEWNENFKFVVKDPKTQVLELHVFDWEKVKLHDKLGMQVVPLRSLTPHETTTFTLDLLKSLNPNDAHNKKSRGKLVVELTFDPFKEDNWSMGRQSCVQTGEDGDEFASTGGMLLVTIESAQDVEGKKKTNPYVEIVFKGEKKETKVIKKSRDPRWDEEFQFTLDEPPMEDKIHIEVMNKRSRISLHTKESLGHVDISLADVVNNGRINETYHLINSKNGMIHVEIKWITT
ncbi:Calcium-dependent lipid-binding (CaLB domain) family protein [Rhynchospora pubera]|uniref:Calcium-dependent lipid-binding (CaLB domain) family protein n=1 Tax=Rhynchospora pubera TaxID=906938 RepID=A0AAV8GTA7_9POAL|nr:Calcium-dependent lipid-binding (CaLB domain) family protein [Rhynchospora pubera]